MIRKIMIIIVVSFFTVSMTVNSFALGIIDYSTAVEYDDLYDYFCDALSSIRGSEFEDNDLSEIADFVEYASEKSAIVYDEAKNNVALIDGNVINQGYETASEILGKYMEYIDRKGIVLNRTPILLVPVVIKNVDLGSGINIKISVDDLKNIKNTNGIKILFENRNEYISITKENLAFLADNMGYFNIKLSEVPQAYALSFLSEDGIVMEKYPINIKLGLTAESDTDTVYVFYNNLYENWGGQYNSADSLIEIMTKYTGEYSVSHGDVNISDISDLTEYEQKAIKFMAVRGYFDINEEKFNPYGSFTRYRFAEALVRMFFALDNDSVCTFSDVNEQYYKYIASSQENSIVEGFEDGTFRGDSEVTGEQVVALAARTINAKNGYEYPKKPEKYVRSDYEKFIHQWAYNDTALAIREGIYSDDMNMDLKSPVCRKDAAVILYRLFMIMNNTPQVSLIDSLSVNEIGSRKSFWNLRTTVIIVSMTGVADVAALVGGLMYVNKKRKQQ